MVFINRIYKKYVSKSIEKIMDDNFLALFIGNIVTSGIIFFVMFIWGLANS
jgi:hypothetical protein